MPMIRTALYGAIAGAAGTTVLNAVTYADMAVRGRPASETPQQAVQTLADKTGHPIPGTKEQKSNRLAGLGPLTGIATGAAVGVLAGLAGPVLRRLPSPLAAGVVGLSAMAMSDGPLVGLGLTDPKQWSVIDWLSDLAPHLAYGAASYGVLRVLESGNAVD